MFGPVDLRRPPVRHPQLLTTKNTQRQKTVVIVITMEKTAFLMAVDRIIGRVEIENSLGRRLGERRDKPLNDDLANRHRAIAAMRPVLQPAQRRTRTRRFIALGRRLRQGVLPQLVMVIAVFMAQTQRAHPLFQQTRQGMLNQSRRSRIANPSRNRIKQPDLPIRLPQQQRATVAADFAAAKICLDSSLLHGRKFDTFQGAIRPGRNPLSNWSGNLILCGSQRFRPL